jgi:hypothetical protein
VSLVWTILGFAYGSRYVVIPVSGAVSLTLSLLYTVTVWDRISFAATNLSVALKVLRETLVIIFVGLCVLAMTFLWTIWWMCAFIGTFNFLNDDEGLSNDWMSVVVAFYFFSYYWTFQVIKVSPFSLLYFCCPCCYCPTLECAERCLYFHLPHDFSGHLPNDRCKYHREVVGHVGR